MNETTSRTESGGVSSHSAAWTTALPRRARSDDRYDNAARRGAVLSNRRCGSAGLSAERVSAPYEFFRGAYTSCICTPFPYRLPAVKLIKQHVNGRESVVLKQNATPADLRAEAMRMEQLYGYEVKQGETGGQYIATHPFFRGKFIISLEPE